MHVTASAPGKLVLFGDHAVVHGQPGIVTAVDLRYRVQAECLAEPLLRIETPTLPEFEVPFPAPGRKYHAETAYVEAALRQLLVHSPIDCGFHIRTQGPEQSFGLGSSSAITVATLAATARLCQIELSRRDLYEMARTAVLDVQGAGSGLDVAAAVYGGTCYLERVGATPEPLAVAGMSVVIGYSGSKVSTTALLRKVAALRARQPDLIEPIFALMGRLTIRARDSLLEGRWCDLGRLADINQGLLDTLGVNTASLSRLIFAARAAGAWGAKLSGAGGGDCMFALTNTARREEVAAQIPPAGGRVIDVNCNAPGVSFP